MSAIEGYNLKSPKKETNKKKIGLFMKIDKKGTLIKGINKKKVKIPKEVKIIGKKAFKDCDKIEEVIFSDECLDVEICLGAFQNCRSLKKIDISKFNDLEEAIFVGCSSLEEVNLSNNLHGIPTFMFEYCNSLKAITIPSSVREIGASAFARCINLEDVKFPENLLSIQNSAFFRCKLPKHLTLPNSVNFIGHNSFRGIFSEEIDLPEELNNIGYLAFSDSKLKRVVIPQNVDFIGYRSFENCEQLEEVIFLCNIKELEEEMFYGCSVLQKIVLPENLKSINARVFNGCAFRKIDIPKSVKKIGYETFENCKNLKEIELPDEIDTIEHLTFSNCLSLKNVQLPNNLREIGNNAFAGCINLENLTINNNIRYISEKAFKGCLSLDLNIETSLFEFSGFRNSHKTDCKIFEVKNLTIYGKEIDIRSIYTCGEMVDEIDRIRKEELLDKFKAKLEELNVNLIIEVILNDYIEKIISNFNSGSIYNYEKDFNDYLLKYIDIIKNIHLNNNVMISNLSNNKEDASTSIEKPNIENNVEITKTPENTKYIQILYDGRIYNIPLDFNILLDIKAQEDIEFIFENNIISRDGINQEQTFNINNALRRAYINRLSKLNIDETLKKYIEHYDKYIEYKDSTSVICVKTMVNELAYIYYLEYTSKQNKTNVIEEPLNSVRLDKGLDKRLVKSLNKYYSFL